RRPGGPGRRRRPDAAHVAGPDPARVRAQRAPLCDRGLGGHGRDRRRDRAAAWRTPGAGRLASGVPGQRARGSARPGIRRPDPVRAPRGWRRPPGPARRAGVHRRHRRAGRGDRQRSGLGATVVLLPAIWWRSERHPSPLFEPAMLRVRSFSLAVTASILFFAGFAAMLLSGVLFLTTVWHEDVLTAGLMLFPGPLMAAVFSVPSARLGARFGYRLPGVAGALLFAVASVYWITQTGDTPAYLTQY